MADTPDVSRLIYSQRKALDAAGVPTVSPVGAPVSDGWRAAWAAQELVRVRADADRLRAALREVTPCAACAGTGEVGDHYMVTDADGEAQEVDARQQCAACRGTGCDLGTLAELRARAEAAERARIEAADLLGILGETAWGVELPALDVAVDGVPVRLAPESAKRLVEHVYQRLKRGRGWLREAQRERDEARNEVARLERAIARLDSFRAQLGVPHLHLRYGRIYGPNGCDGEGWAWFDGDTRYRLPCADGHAVEFSPAPDEAAALDALLDAIRTRDAFTPGGPRG